LQVAHSFIPHTYAGTEVYTYSLSKELGRRNQVFVFFRVNNPKEEEYALRRSNIDGIETYAINHTFNKSRSFEDTYSDITIDDIFGKLLDDINPDIVHIQHLLFLSLGIVKEAKKRGLPVIFTLNDYWLICQKGQLIMENMALCDGYDLKNCQICLRSSLSIRPNSVYLYNMLRKYAPKLVLHAIRNIYVKFVSNSVYGKNMLKKRFDCINEIMPQVNLFTSPSDFLKNKFIKFGVPENKIIRSSYGIDRNKTNIGLKTKSSFLRFGFIGTLVPTKGLHVLTEALKKVKNNNLELLVFGKLVAYVGYENYMNTIKYSAQKDKRIKLMGPFKNDDIGQIFSQIDILVVPSIWPENAPIVIQEAFLSNTPVIASRIGGVPELINHGVNGLLFNAKDVDDLAQKIKYVLTNPEILTGFKKNMPRIKNIEENAEELEIFYNHIVNQ